jgi:hypothetical protein
LPPHMQDYHIVVGDQRKLDVPRKCVVKV